jgi:hypothetical protein
MTLRVLLYLSARFYTGRRPRLVGIEELAAVRYANEQCTASTGLNGGLCNLCCSLGSGDGIVVGWKDFFDEADAAEHVSRHSRFPRPALTWKRLFVRSRPTGLTGLTSDSMTCVGPANSTLQATHVFRSTSRAVYEHNKEPQV